MVVMVMRYIHINHVAVFGMNHRRHTQCSRLHHNLEHITVTEFHRRIGHVEFDARDAFLIDHRFQFVLENLLGRLRQDQMEPIVDVGLAVGTTVVLFHNGKQ